MTVSSNPFPIRYSGDGVSTTFAVGAYFLEELDGSAHLLVTIRNADGTETAQTQTTDYTVAGAANPAGGSITFVTPPASDKTVVITRSVPDTQEVDYLANDAFPAETHERALDKLTMRLQQRANDLDRALLLGITDTTGSGAYDAGSNRIINLGTPTADSDAATKVYVDDAVAAGGGGGGGGGGVTDHGALTGLADDDHPHYLNETRGNVLYNTKAEITSFLNGKAATSHTHTASEITDFGESVDDQVDGLLTAGTDIGLNYDDAAGTLTINYTGGGGGGGGTWDLPSLKADYSATGDGVADDTSAVSSAITAAEAFFVPTGSYDTTKTAAQLTVPFRGDGQIITSDGYKRGKIFSLVDAAPATTSNRDSIQQAFHGDMSGVSMAVEHRITGAATMGQPTSGYSYRHECYPHFTYLRNDSGHNNGTSGNDGRTGACAYQTKVDQYGQGDAVAYNALVYVNGTKSGSTSYLANPAGAILNGSVIAGATGVYLNTVEFDMQDNGYDCAGIGTVTNMNRTVGTGAKGAVWKGHLVQSIGTADIDVGYSVAGKAKIGLDFTQATLQATARAITMKSGQKVFFNASADSGYTYANQSGSEFIYWSGSSLVMAAGNQPVIQVQSSNLVVAPSGSGKFKVTTSDVSAVGDFKVASSLGGSNYFRASASEVNCSVQLKVNDVIDIYNGTLAAGKTALGSYLRIKLGGVDRYLALYN